MHEDISVLRRKKHTAIESGNVMATSLKRVTMQENILLLENHTVA
jgi:hypothetical protein